MLRRKLLKYAYAGTVSALGATASATTATAHGTEPLGVAWQQTYDDIAISSATLVHGGGGHIFVNRNGRTDPNVPIRLVRIDENGTVRKRQEITPDIPEDARRAGADVVRTEDGYAVASGSWFATFDEDLVVGTTGYAGNAKPNRTTHLANLSDRFVVAAEVETSNHVSVHVFGFDTDGNLTWSQEYAEEYTDWLEFLVEDPNGGVVVGGREPWLVSLDADGTERWQTALESVPSAEYDAAIDEEGISLFSGSNLVRLDDSQSVEWNRPYDSVAGASGGEVVQTADFSYVGTAQVESGQIGAVGADYKGRPLWEYTYDTPGTGGGSLTDIAEGVLGEYLVVGSGQNEEKGWALLLSNEETPKGFAENATTTATSQMTDGTTTANRDGADPTRGTSGTASTGTTADSQTSAPVPGFGMGTALVGTVAGWFAHQWSDDSSEK